MIWKRRAWTNCAADDSSSVISVCCPAHCHPALHTLSLIMLPKPHAASSVRLNVDMRVPQIVSNMQSFKETWLEMRAPWRIWFVIQQTGERLLHETLHYFFKHDIHDTLFGVIVLLGLCSELTRSTTVSVCACPCMAEIMLYLWVCTCVSHSCTQTQILILILVL